MAIGPKTSTSIIIIIFVIVVGVTATDLYRDYHMKENAGECGFIRTVGTSKECECSGDEVDDDSFMNPLFQKAGDVNYYCYGDCSGCVCYRRAYDSSFGEPVWNVTDCSKIS